MLDVILNEVFEGEEMRMSRKIITNTIDLTRNYSIADKAPAMICIYNIKTGNYIYANDAVRKILGYSQSEFLKKGLPFVASLVHPDDMEKIAEKNSKALKQANSSNKKSIDDLIVNFEYRMRHKNGNWRWIHSDGSVFSRDKKGKVEYVMNVSVDITERKKREEEVSRRIEESEQRHKAFIEQSSEGIWRFELKKPVSVKADVSQQIEHFYKYAYLAECNDAMAKMYGYKKAEDIVGFMLSKFLIPSDPTNIEYLKAFINSGYRLAKTESHEKDKDGNDRYFENNLTGIVENGFLTRAWGTQSDVTEKRKIEDAIRQSEERLRIATAAGKIGIWDWDIGKKLTWTDRVYQILGLKRDEFEPTFERFKKLIYPPDVKHVTTTIENCLRHKTSYQAEFRAVTPQKEIIWLYMSAKLILDEKKRPSRMVGAIIDVTERKTAEIRKDDFIALASHELKTPVTSLKLHTYVLKKKAIKRGDYEMEKSLAGIEDQVNRLTVLVKDLLDVTRMQKGKIELSTERFDIKNLIMDTVSEMKKITKHRIETDDIKAVDVVADKERIRQVIINLITNAIKYSPKSRKIHLGMTRKNGSVSISVKDFGVGIPKDQTNKIFDRFYQVRSKRSHTYPGLGLGLYISKEIIDRHKGKIWVESKVGKGSTFFFTLPSK